MLAERSELQLCATLLYDEATARLAITSLTREDFANPQCQTFFGHYQHAAESRNQAYVDPRDLIEGMAKSPAFEDVSAVRQWMISLAKGELATPLKAYTTWNIQAIKAASAKRRAHETVTRVAEELASGGLTAEMVASARDSLGDALAVNRSATRTIGASVGDLLDAMASGSLKGRAVPTGLSALDATIGGGFLPGEIVVVAARPGGGKTSFGLQLVHNAASVGKRVLVSSLEMRCDELTLRLICNRSGVSFLNVKRGGLDLIERQRFAQAANEVANWQIGIDDEPTRRVHEIEAHAREFAKQGGLDLLVIDYLQLITPAESKYTNRQEQVARISRELKILARSLGVPVVVLAQVRRAESPKAKPSVSELRESGAIEQDADVVLLLHGANQGRHDPHVAQILIGKQRNGPQCEVDVQWTGPCMRFEDIPPSEDVF
jgi:replicative DNA helicase